MNYEKEILIISPPCSPSRLMDCAEMKCDKISLASGGGLVFRTTTYYAISIDKNEYKPMWKINTIEGDEICINPAYVIAMQKVKVVKQVTDTTAHKNYEKLMCEKAITTQYFDVGNNDYEINKDAFYPRTSEKAELIKRIEKVN